MITNEGKARQVDTYRQLKTRKAFIAMRVDPEKVHEDFFENYEFSKTRFKSIFWSLLPYIIETSLYVAVFIYLFTWRSALFGLTPAAGIMFVVWLMIQVSKYHIKKVYKPKKHRTPYHVL
jgi:hypothetical protein